VRYRVSLVDGQSRLYPVLGLRLDRSSTVGKVCKEG
jgi:hypothetical protein